MDHLGVGKPVNGDSIYNGADDDASGCVAVLQLARALAAGQRPKRTVLFVFFGSEETGGQGDQYFLLHPPLPLDHIVANLEFEMIGRPDPQVKPDQLWLTGFERSNLGPELARRGRGTGGGRAPPVFLLLPERQGRGIEKTLGPEHSSVAASGTNLVSLLAIEKHTRRGRYSQYH